MIKKLFLFLSCWLLPISQHAIGCAHIPIFNKPSDALLSAGGDPEFSCNKAQAFFGEKNDVHQYYINHNSLYRIQTATTHAAIIPPTEDSTLENISTHYETLFDRIVFINNPSICEKLLLRRTHFFKLYNIINAKTYYEALGFDNSTVTQGEIKKKYHKSARITHPDHFPNDHIAEEAFKEASKAYKVLSDENKRKEYNSNLQKYFCIRKSLENYSSDIEYYTLAGCMHQYSQMQNLEGDGLLDNIISELPFIPKKVLKTATRDTYLRSHIQTHINQLKNQDILTKAIAISHKKDNKLKLKLQKDGFCLQPHICACHGNKNWLLTNNICICRDCQEAPLPTIPRSPKKESQKAPKKESQNCLNHLAS